MKYFTKADTPYYGKPKVYFCCHPDDYELCFGDIAKDIFSTQNCSIWFCEDVNLRSSEEHLLELKQMQLFVLPVTAKLLNTSNPALDVEFPFALENKIPVLPLMQEGGWKICSTAGVVNYSSWTKTLLIRQRSASTRS